MSWKHYHPASHLTPANQEAAEALQRAIKIGRYELERVDCAACSRDDTELLFGNDRYGTKWQTVVCRYCGLVYSNPRFTVESNARFYESDEYRALYSPKLLGDPGTRFDYETVDHSTDYHRLSYYEFIMSNEDRIDTVAEIGAGGGWNLKPFHDQGKRCVGVEFSPTLVEMGAAYGIEMIQGDLDSLRGSYDLILLKHVFEHFLDPVGQLDSLRSRLTLNGSVMIEVPGFVDDLPSIQSAHTYYYSSRTLRAILCVGGFTLTALRIFESNGYLMALARPTAERNLASQDSTEYERIMSVIHRSRRQHLVHRMSVHIPSPIRKVLRPLKRTI